VKLLKIENFKKKLIWELTNKKNSVYLSVAFAGCGRPVFLRWRKSGSL